MAKDENIEFTRYVRDLETLANTFQNDGTRCGTALFRGLGEEGMSSDAKIFVREGYWEKLETAYKSIEEATRNYRTEE